MAKEINDLVFKECRQFFSARQPKPFFSYPHRFLTIHVFFRTFQNLFLRQVTTLDELLQLLRGKPGAEMGYLFRTNRIDRKSISQPSPQKQFRRLLLIIFRFQRKHPVIFFYIKHIGTLPLFVFLLKSGKRAAKAFCTFPVIRIRTVLRRVQLVPRLRQIAEPT